MSANYSLEVISHHPQFNNKALRQYYMDGINTIGAWGDEPFEIRFKNNTYSRVQVKLSLDGTDVFSGKVADTNPSDKMWVVNGKETLSLKAWPETNHGGAAFVFTNVNNSVAANTHGNLSSKGIIAAAVFVEGYTPTYHYVYPYTYCSVCGYSHYLSICPRSTITIGGSVGTYNPYWLTNTSGSIGLTGSSQTVFNNSVGNYSADSNYFCATNSVDSSCLRSLELQSTASVGAGQHVDQNISYVAGLTQPVFSENIRVRYMWWDELQAALRSANGPAPHASGFPGDTTRGHINLGRVPRVGGGQGCFRRVEVEYSRV